MADDENEQEYGLVMPFICTTNSGGPYDSKAFVAGCRTERVNCTLEMQKPEEYQIYVEPELVAQLDLVAMHHGYSMTHEPWEDFPDEWELATFTKQRNRDAKKPTP